LMQILRQIMVQVIGGLWVEYLTSVEALRTSIGLEAYAQRDPLVAYKAKASEMFEQLTINIRSGIVARAYTYLPRIMAEGAAAPTGRAAAQAAVAAPAPAGNGAGRALPAAVAAAAVAPPEARNLGRNDPCWCGSGKKYKDCHWDRDHAAKAGPAA